MFCVPHPRVPLPSPSAHPLPQTHEQYSDVDYRNEPSILSALNHPNIVKLTGLYQTPTTLFILLEAHLGGDLYSQLSALRASSAAHSPAAPTGAATPLPTPAAAVCAQRAAAGGQRRLREDLARGLLRQLLVAVEHCHARGVVHRDIKPANVVLSTDRSSVILADFGLSEALPAGTGLLTSVCGTHDFLAPEMILCGWGEVAGYGTAVDMWAIGLLLFCILYETNPFEHASEIETLQAIVNAEFDFPEGGSTGDEARYLISRLLVANPDERWTVHQCLQHEWIAGAPDVPSLVRVLPPCHTPAAATRSMPHRSMRSSTRSAPLSFGDRVQRRGESSGAVQVF